jgi:hypothetical protein
MAYTTVNKSTDYFRVKLFTGNGSNDTAITWDESSNMQADFLWFKNRSEAQSHALFDVIRGADKRLISNSSGAEGTEATNLDSFDTNGFTVDNELIVNGSGDNMVTWGWKANGSGSSNTDGATNTTVSVNTTAGFSIVNWTGTGSATTLGHGLGAVPKFWMIKNLDQAEDWRVYHNSLGNTKTLELNNTDAEASDISYWNNTSPTSSVMTVGSSNANNGSGRNMIAYCFADVPGYCRIGTYVGNGDADGAYVYTGMKPAFVIIKDASAVNNWRLFDNKRPEFNLTDKLLFPSLSDAEAVNVSGSGAIDILSNGFKIRSSANGLNASGSTYIYMAIGQSIVGTNNIPCVAR